MKKILSSFLILSSFTLVNAQNEINGGPVNIPAEGVIDGIYIQEHIPTKRLVPYEFVREADVMFQKRIWRSIDMREKINHAMYYPMDEFLGNGDWVKNTTRWSLWTVIRHHIMKGDLVMYDHENPINPDLRDGDLFKYPIQLAPGKSYDTDTTFKDNVLRLIAKVTPKMENGVPAVKRDPVSGDPIIVKNPKTGIDEEVPEDPDIRWVISEDIVEYRLKEDWFFDKERSQFDVRILGLAPVVYDAERDAKGEITTIKGKKILFWLYFPHCRFVFVNYNVYNPKNDAQWMSFDDLFQKRQFNSTIYKQSNTFDRTIDTYKSGIDALYESQKITEEFRNFEHDLWHF